MKLAAKFVSILLVGIFVLTGLRIYFAFRHEESEFDAEMAAETEHIAAVLRETITDLGHDWAQEVTSRRVAVAHSRETNFSLRFLLPHESAETAAAITGGSRTKWLAVRDADGVVHAHCLSKLDDGGTHLGWFEYTKPATELYRNKMSAFLRNLWVALATATLGVVLVAVVGVRMIGRPVEMLVEKTRRVAAGDLSGPVQLRSSDELNELAQSINDMCTQLAESQRREHEATAARLKAMDQLRHTDRLRTVGRLAAGLAHELGTPLNVVSGRAELIAQGKLSENDSKESAATIKREAERMTSIIRKLLDFARRSSPQQKTMNLHRLAAETTDLLSSLAKKRNVELEVRSEDPTLSASVDAGQMQQVLTNLIMNAIQAMPEGGQVRVGLEAQRATAPSDGDEAEAVEADYVCISIQDEGEGIVEENLDQVFEPFFTTKDVGEGTGLGLSIAYGIVQEHGGWIDVDTEPGQGTCFTVYLPRETPA
jgi:signal transduction histidine kinase